MGKRHLMIVDDDQYTIDLYQMMMEMSDNDSIVSTEMNPVEALKKLERIAADNQDDFPDLILLDISMPQLNGFDFIDLFLEKFPQNGTRTRFFITTSSVLEKDKKKAMNYECVEDYIIKPLPASFFQDLLSS
jgi:CheY-like chemotaxis protein